MSFTGHIAVGNSNSKLSGFDQKAHALLSMNMAAIPEVCPFSPVFVHTVEGTGPVCTGLTQGPLGKGQMSKTGSPTFELLISAWLCSFWITLLTHRRSIGQCPRSGSCGGTNARASVGGRMGQEATEGSSLSIICDPVHTDIPTY